MTTPAKTKIVVNFENFVTEGDNYAGFTGYRPRTVTMDTREEMIEWLATMTAQKPPIKVTNITEYAFVCELDPIGMVVSAKMHKAAKDKAAELAHLEDVQKRIAEKLAKIKA